MSAFYKLREFISFLDLILSLSKYSISSNSLTRVQFGENILLQSARHPILNKIKEKISTSSLNKNEQFLVSEEKIVTNTLKLSPNIRFLVLTGSNMSGKSTFLRQLGDLQVMGQCGSYVPADKAILSLKSKILSLCGDFDDLSGSLNSSFECQVNEMKKILENLSDNSLILIDEFGKHTNYYEGLAISFAVTKNIIDTLIEENRKNILIVFSTHYTELNYLESCYSEVNCYHLKSNYDESQRLVHSYELEKGVCEIKNYGQKLLEQSALPNAIVQDSRNLLNFFKVDLQVISYFSFSFFSFFFKELLTKNELESKKELIFSFYNELIDLSDKMESMTNMQLYDQVDLLVQNFEDKYSKLSNFDS